MPASLSHAVSNGAPQVSLELDEDKSFVSNFADCLNFSTAFSLSGFETINDKLLCEMNQRAKHQMELEREHELQKQQEHQRSNSSTRSLEKDSIHTSLRTFAQITRSPPENRFTAVHNRVFANADSILPSPHSKRTGTGEESPSKRRRAPSGSAIGIPNSPTKPLLHLSLNNKDHLEQVSAARHREKQRRDQQTSPRRRIVRRGPLNSSHEHPFAEAVDRNIPGSIPKIPSLKLDLPPPKVAESTPSEQKAQTEPSRPPQPVRNNHTKENRSLPKPPSGVLSQNSVATLPRSQTMRPMTRSSSQRSVSSTPTSNIKHNLPPLPAFTDNNLPSFARPTQATLRKSQSIHSGVHNVAGNNNVRQFRYRSASNDVVGTSTGAPIRSLHNSHGTNR